MKQKFHFVFFLAILSVVGFLCTDMYLPAFDKMRLDFDTTKSNISYSLSLFLAGFAIAQILWGAVADRIGNRKAILYGLFIFALTSIIIFITKNIWVFLALRVLQAIGACAATVCWQSLVIERYPETQTNKIFSSIMPLVALSPALAPLLGVFILQHLGWRPIFMLLACVALLLMLYTFFLKDIKNSSSKKNNPINYTTFFKNKIYIGNVLMYGFCSGGFFAWLTGAPFFLKFLGYDETAIGLSFIPQTIAFLIGGYGLRLVLEKINGKIILPYLLGIYSISLLLILFLAIFTTPTLTTLLIPFSFMAFSNGATYPIVVNEAMKIFPHNSGKSSGLQNTLQLGICFLCSGFVSIFSANALLATAIVMAATIPFALLGWKWANK